MWRHRVRPAEAGARAGLDGGRHPASGLDASGAEHLTATGPRG